MTDTYVIRWVRNCWHIWYRNGENKSEYRGSFHGPIEEWMKGLHNHDPSQAAMIISR